MSLRYYINESLSILEKYWWSNKKPYNHAKPIKTISIPKKGIEMEKILNEVGAKIIHKGVNTAHPKTVAHMHCLPTMASIIAELLIGATNQSLDSWDESPIATHIEEAVVKFFCNLVGYDKNSDGIIDSGGTMSNQTAVLIARDSFIEQRFNMEAKNSGVPKNAISKMKILCSEQSHFSIEKAATICGLGSNSIIKIPVTNELTINEELVERYVKLEKQKGNYPFLVVATAGTTNAGNTPDLKKIGKICKEHKIHYHIDAAYGGSLLFSKKYRHILDGIESADSITIDPHKMLYQSISCGLFLLKDKSKFKHLTFHSEYLNPKSDVKNGIVNFVDKSLQTTRRFDALKLYMSLHHLGKDGYDKIITGTIDMAQKFAKILDKQKMFELATNPQTNIVLFRFVGTKDNDLGTTNNLNEQIQKLLFHEGEAILSKTKINNTTYLKATCMNPLTTEKDFIDIVKQIKKVVNNREKESKRGHDPF